MHRNAAMLARRLCGAFGGVRPRTLATFLSPLPDVTIPSNLSYPEYVLQGCEQIADKTAMVCANSGKRVSYADLVAGCRAAASGLAKLGFAPKDVMCIYAQNCVQYPMAMYGIMLAGGTITTANPDYTAAELANQLKDCSSKFLLTTKDKLDVAAEAAKASGVVKEIFLVDERHPGTRCFSDLLDDDGRSFPGGSFAFDQEKDTAAILYSSGTTGLPKGVMLSHRNLVGNVEQCLASLDKRREERLLGVLPFFHVYGQVPVLAVTFRYRSQISIMRRFDPTLFLETVQNDRLTWTHVVPPIVLFLLAHPMVEKYDLSSLTSVISAAAPLGIETEQAFRKKFPNIDISQGWGMTELGPAGSLTPPLDSPWRKHKPGAVGLLLPNQQMRVVDPDSGRELGRNETGEFQFRGVNVMQGYYGNSKATAESFTDDGWFRTGDVGHIDDDSYLFMSDRLKELIKVKGLQVAPAELEDLLLECPHVADVGVIAKADERAGELPMAFVVKKKDSEAGEMEIRDWLAERVAPHKRLEGGVRFVAAIPRAASGKILRKDLRGLLAAETSD